MSKAKLQLEKDVLRFLELNQDLKVAGKIVFTCLAAFPSAENTEGSNKDMSNILTKADMENANKFLDKIGIKKPVRNQDQGTYLDSEDLREVFHHIICRYAGALSAVPLKSVVESLRAGKDALDDNIRKTETALRLQIENITATAVKSETDESRNESLKKSLSKLEINQKIFDALKKPNFKETFKKDYPGIQIDDLKNFYDDNNFEYLVEWKKSKRHPIFGIESIRTLLKHFDKKTNHQGLQEIIKVLKKEKIKLYVQSEEKIFEEIQELKWEKLMGEHFHCELCNLVERLKASGRKERRKVFLERKEDIDAAINFGDQKHSGDS